MKHDTGVETEIKFRIGSVKAAAARLAACGFILVHPEAEEVSVLWDREGELRSRGCALRVRRYHGEGILTWKGPRVEDPLMKIRPETETGVEDPEALEAILSSLGYAPALEMVKRRAIWRREALEACLDEAPFGCFLELEGARDAIEAAMAELGLGASQVETRSYPALFSAARSGEGKA
jgi:adenylate cyclase class 2